MATVIPCIDIEQEADRLLQLFKSCYTLTATDLDDLVNLMYSASLCGSEPIVPPDAIDQNNIISYVGTNNGTTSIPDVVTAINSRSSFVVGDTEIIIFLHTYESSVDTGSVTLIQEDWLFRLGKGTYGAGETQITSGALYRLNKYIDTTLIISPGSVEPPSVKNLYADLVVGGNMTSPSIVVNGYAEAFEIINGKDQYFRLFPTRPTDTRQPYNLYRFVGVAGDYGTGGDVTNGNDFVLVHQYLGDSGNINSNTGIRIREISVPAVVDPTSFTYGSVSDVVNGSLSRNVDVAQDEIVLFLIDSIERIQESGNTSVILKSQKWAWNKGSQTSVNVGSVDSDFTLIDTYNTITVTSAIETPSGVAEIYSVKSASVTTIADAITALNLLTGGDRLVFNNNLVLLKVSNDNDTTDYKIWEFTGAVTGNGIYGVAGLTPVVGDFNPVSIIDGTVITSNELSASNIPFNDSIAQLSAVNVQEALDILISSLMYRNTNLMPNTVGGYAAGTSFPIAQTMQQMFDGLLYEYILPTYTPNILTIDGITAQTLEVGTLFSDTLVTNYNQGIIESKDGSPNIPLTGIVTEQRFTGAGVGLASGIISTRILFGSGNQWTLSVDYAAGAGNYYDSNGNIATNLDSLRVADTIMTTSPRITGLYKYWIFKGAVTTSPITSAPIRALTEDGFAENKTFDVTIPTGDREVSIYLPQGMFLISVLYVESAMANVTGDFAATALTVNDAEGVSVNYTKHTQDIGGIGYLSDATYRITIADAV